MWLESIRNCERAGKRAVYNNAAFRHNSSMGLSDLATAGKQAVKGVIFDLDGTVIDTERFSLVAWPKVSRELGYPVTEEMTRRFVGQNEATERKLLCDEFGDAFPYDKIRDEILRLHHETAEKEGITVKKGFWDLMACIKKAAIPYSLATSTSRAVVGWKLEHAGLSGVFSLIVCGDEVENGKPAPDIFLKAVRMTRQEPEDCIGIEDSEAGLRGLRSAGIRSVFIKDLVTPAKDVLAGIWRECGDLGEVRALLDGCD